MGNTRAPHPLSVLASLAFLASTGMLLIYLMFYDSTPLRDPGPGPSDCRAHSRSHYEWNDYTPCATRADVELTISIIGFGVMFLFVLLRCAVGRPRKRWQQRANDVEGHSLTTFSPRDDDHGDGGAGITTPAPAYIREAEDVIEPPPAYTSRAPSRMTSLVTITPTRQSRSSADSLSWHSAMEPQDRVRPNRCGCRMCNPTWS
ncbi:MAG: hypothetical protein LQ350_000392 [Teloschistes chrysophthalmus]|nr:MAG: hypothetical protein LQ350_000392 [Niorma chrysophthalma]